MPNGVCTGKSIQGQERALAIMLLAAGHSVHAVSVAIGSDWSTVRALQDDEFSDIQKRKPILAAQAERNALLAGEHIAYHLQSKKPGRIKLRDLVPVYGVNIDKVVSLRATDQPPPANQHLHLHLQAVDTAKLYNDFLAGLKLSLPSRTLPSPQNNGDTAHDDGDDDRQPHSDTVAVQLSSLVPSSGPSTFGAQKEILDGSGDDARSAGDDAT